MTSKGGVLITPFFAVALSFLGAFAACNKAPAVAAPARAQAKTAPQPVAEASEEPKAHMALKDIQPQPSVPKHPADLAPLSERSQQQVAKAQDLLGQRRFTEAAIELERALRYDPNHPAVHAVLALLHWQAGNTERAKTHAERAIEGDPAQANPHYVLGRYFAQNNDARRAMLEYRTVLLCPDAGQDSEVQTLTHYYLGRILSSEGYYAAALSQFDTFRTGAAALQSGNKTLLPETANVIATAPTALARDESIALEKLGQVERAAEALRPLVSQEPQDVELAIRYANLLLQAGKTDEALSTAQNIESDDEKVIWLLFEIYERRGEAGRAVDEIRARLSQGDGDEELTMRLADVLVRLNRPADAAKTLEEYLQQKPDATAVRVKLLPMLTASGEWDKALTIAADGLRRSPEQAKEIESAIFASAGTPDVADKLVEAASGRDDFAASYLAALAALAKNDTQRAESLFRKAAEAKPDFAPALVGLGRLYVAEYAYDRALEVANRAKELNNQSARAEQLLATIYDRLDRTDAAEEHYRTAYQLDRSDTAPVIALAELYLRTSQAHQAQLTLQNLLASWPNLAKAHELLSMVYLTDGKRDLALQECEQIRNLSDAPNALARCLARVDIPMQRDFKARREMLLDAIEKGGPDADTWVAIGMTYAPSEYQAQREAFLKALEIDAGHEDALAGLFENDKQFALNFESAAKWLEQLLKKRPNQHEWRRELAVLYTLMNDFDKAVSLTAPYVESIDLDEKELVAYRSTYVGALRADGRDELVTQMLQSWADHDTPDHRWSETLAEHYFSIKEFTKAADIFAKLAEDAPSPEYQRKLTVALAADKQYDRAEQYILSWLLDDPENDLLVGLMAAQLAEAGQLEPSLEVVRNHLLRTLRRQDFQDWMIARLSASDRHDDAVKLAESLLDNVITVLRQPAEFKGPNWQKNLRDDERILYPDSFESEVLHSRLETLRLRLANTLFVAENYHRAAELLTDWLDTTNDPSVRFVYLRTLAAAQQAQGQEEAASGTMERALLLRPTDIGLNNDLAYTWIDRGIRIKDAEPMIRYSVGRAPAQPAYLDTFGWLHYKEGNFAEAEKWLKRASFARRREDPVILDHLGDCAWRLGKTEEAIAHWNKAIELFNQREADDRAANADERRAQRDLPKKVDEASAGRTPSVAPLQQADQQSPASDQGAEKSKSSG